MAARTNACSGYVPEELPNLYTEVGNAPLTSTFENFVTWKNREDGVLGEKLGSIIFRNMKIADSKHAGFEAYKTNYTTEGVSVENFMIVGKSNNPETSENFYLESRGIIAPRTNGLSVTNVRFYNFDEDMILL